MLSAHKSAEMRSQHRADPIRRLPLRRVTVTRSMIDCGTDDFG